MLVNDPLQRYVEMVLDEEIITPKTIKQAVKRFESDLERDDWDWVYKPELAKHVIDFLEILPDPKTRKPTPLANFQKFIVGMLYGWVHKDSDLIRRFIDAFISLARKNGKSLLVSGLIIYEFLFGKNPANSRQLFTAANDRTQAKIVFNMVKGRIEALRTADAGVRKIVKVKRDEILNLRDGSKISSLSRDSNLADGFEPQMAVVDEYANAKTNEMVKTINSGRILLDSPLTFIISTAGFNLNAPMFTENYPAAKRVLAGEVDLERYFVFIAENEDKSEADKPETYIKSNPLIEVADIGPKIIDTIASDVEAGKNDGSLSKVLIKNLNIWTQDEENSYIDVDEWDNALEPDFDIHGKDVYIGVDVGRTSDLFAITWLIPDKGRFYMDGYAFVATKYGLEKKIKSDGLNYPELEELGQCELTQLESKVIDFERVYQWLEDFIEFNELNVKALAYDVYQFGTLLTQIEKNHPEWPLIQVRQGTLTLSMPTKQLKDDILSGKVVHSDNQVLKNSFMNAILLSDNNGVRINKNKNSNKIDMADAALNAYAIAFREPEEVSLTDDYVLSDDFGF